MTGNGTQAALTAYETDDYSTAASIANENLNKPEVKEAVVVAEQTLKSALVNQGVTVEKIAEKIDELLDDEDFMAIDKGLKHALAIHGITPDQPKQTQSTYNFIFSDEVRAEVREIEARIKTQLLQPKHAEPDA